MTLRGLLLQTVPIATNSTPEIVVVAVVYFAVCGLIAFWATRRTHTATDFFAAGEGIGLLPMAIAAMAATLSGFIFIGGPGLLYKYGTYALFISLSAGITTPLSAWALGKRMRFLRAGRGLITVPAAVGARYRSPVAHGLSAVALVVASVCYIATNVLGLGLVIDAIFHVGVQPGVIVGSAVVLAYSAAGGILAGVYTDLFQGAIKTVASILVFATVLRVGGGMGGISRTILAHEPGFLGPWGTMTPLGALSLFLLFGLGTLGQPQVIHKYFMLRDVRQLRWYPLVMTVVLLLTLLLFFGVGLSVKAQVLDGTLAPLASQEEATPAFLLHSAPALLAAIVFSGIAAAIMGTVNAFLSISAAALSHDLPVAFGHRLRNELTVGRIATAVVMTLGTLLALWPGQLVSFLGVLAWGLFASTLVPSLAIGLNWPGATKAAAITSIATGLLSTLVLEAIRSLGWYSYPAGVNPSAVALVLSLLAFLIVSWFTRSRASGDLDPDIRYIMEL